MNGIQTKWNGMSHLNPLNLFRNGMNYKIIIIHARQRNHHARMGGGPGKVAGSGVCWECGGGCVCGGRYRRWLARKVWALRGGRRLVPNQSCRQLTRSKAQVVFLQQSTRSGVAVCVAVTNATDINASTPHQT